MNKLVYLMMFILLCYSCQERGEDKGWELKNKQDEAKQGLLKELNSIFDTALQDAGKAEVLLAQLNRKIPNTTPIMENDMALLSAREYVVKAIEASRFQRKLTKNLENIVPSNLSDLLQPEMYLKQLAEKMAEQESNAKVKNEKMSKKMQNYLLQNAEKIAKKIKIYTAFTGNEELLENTQCSQLNFEGDYQGYVDTGANEAIKFKFKKDHIIECDSILISNYLKRDYAMGQEGNSIDPHILAIIKKGKKPLDANYRAGKEIEKEGKYYLGTDYLTLAFKLVDSDDYMVFSLNYDKEIFENSDKTKFIPLRDPGASWGFGNSRVFLSIISPKRHYGTLNPTDGYAAKWYFRGKNVTPLGFVKID